MLIWSGWGIVVVVIAFVAFMLGFGAGDVLETSLGIVYGPAHALGYALGGLVGATSIFFFAKWREGGPGRVFIDEATGERVEVRRSAGSLFFIPTRYWTWIILALAALMAVTTFSLQAAPPDYNY